MSSITISEGSTFIDPELCKKQRALLNACFTCDLKLKQGVSFAMKNVTGVCISDIFLKPKQWEYQKDVDKYLFILKIIAHSKFIFESKFQLMK